VTRKKKPESKKPEKPKREKPAHDLTTSEAISRLFPKPALDAVRQKLVPPPKPGIDE
jgi:hypothetical protein